MIVPFVLTFAALAPNLPPVIQTFDAWERCALETAVAAIPTNPDDRAIARQARQTCEAQGVAFVQLWMVQRHVRFPPDVVTPEQRLANGLQRFWPDLESRILRVLPEARRTGATRVRMRYRR